MLDEKFHLSLKKVSSVLGHNFLEEKGYDCSELK